MAVAALEEVEGAGVSRETVIGIMFGVIALGWLLCVIFDPLGFDDSSDQDGR